MRLCVSAMSAALALAGAAAADTAYLEPSTYLPGQGQTMTVEAAFNDDCCVPKYPVRSDAYAVIQPDGTAVSPDRVESFATSTVLEHTVTGPGTTGFTTGERLGRMGEYVQLDGQYHLVNSDDAEPMEIPPGTPILTSQTATVSSTYVTVGEPTWESVRIAVGRLAITPQQHPSALYDGDVFDLTVTFDGAPLFNQTVVLTRSGQKERPGDLGEQYTTDENGRVSVVLENTGTYLLMTRIQAPAPKSAETDIRSYTTSLTFRAAASD